MALNDWKANSIYCEKVLPNFRFALKSFTALGEGLLVSEESLGNKLHEKF